MLGATYAASAVLLAGLFLRDVWRAMAAVDAGLTFLLILSAVCGGWFVLLAFERLGRRGRSHRGHPFHTGAATR